MNKAVITFLLLLALAFVIEHAAIAQINHAITEILKGL